MINPRSLYAFIISALLILYCSYVFVPRWQRTSDQAAISWDASGYYWPLPSVFIYKDVRHQRFAESILAKYRPTPDFQQAVHYEPGNDKYVFRYTFGMAILYSPSFFLAHLTAEPLGFPADGFSLPYQFAMQTGAVVMALLGLWYLRKLLLQYYRDTTVAIVMLLLCVGTNYLNYAGIDNLLTHCWLFTLYVFLLLNTHFYYQSPKLKYAARIGFLIGLITLVRPSDIICCIIPLLWGMNNISFKAIKEKIIYLWKNWKHFLLAGTITGLLIFWQLAYWEWATTYWLMNTYQGQKFTFAEPHFYEYMFSYRSGWVTYTPMIFLFIAGFILYFFKGRNKVPIIVFSLLNLYIVVSWEQWWYSGTGGRAMIQSYPILLFPVATLTEFAWKNIISRWFFIVSVLIFTYCNIWFTYQAHRPNGLFDSESMNKEYFWNVIGRWSVPEEFGKMKDYDEFYYGTPKNMHLLYNNNFENDSTLNNRAVVLEGTRSYMIDGNHKSSGWFKAPMPDYKADRIRVQATCHAAAKEWTIYKWSQFMVRFYRKDSVVKERMIYVDRYLTDGGTKDIFIDVKIPAEKTDSFGVSFWAPQIVLPIYVDNLKVWSFDE